VRRLWPRIVHAKKLAGGKKHNSPRPDVLARRPDRPGHHDNRNVVLVAMLGISSARLQHRLVRMELR
jgi:hypothetical protein